MYHVCWMAKRKYRKHTSKWVFSLVTHKYLNLRKNFLNKLSINFSVNGWNWIVFFFFHFSLWLLRLSRPMIIYRCTEDVSKAKEAHCTHSFYLTPGLFKKALPKEVYLLLKVSKTWKQIVKPWILPKNKQMNSTLLLWYLRSTCFRLFFGRIEDTKKSFLC